MIFVTVGTQLPFDRLVRTVDVWAARTKSEVFAQIGPGHAPEHIRWTRTLPADECNSHIRHARAVVAHAGMGSILTALQYGKPIIVLPRRANLGEHRNDHQVTTAKHFHEQGRIRVAFDENELSRQLDEIATLQPTARIASVASPALIGALRSFIQGATRGASDSRTAQTARPIADSAIARA